jgi:hypothetical protein
MLMTFGSNHMLTSVRSCKIIVCVALPLDIYDTSNVNYLYHTSRVNLIRL